MFFRNGQKDLDDLWVKLAAGATFDLFAGVGHRQGSAIRTVADHGIERIRNRKYARSQRNLITLQSAGIAGTVKELLMGEDDFCRVAQKRDANQHVVADFAVFAHFPFFRFIEWAGFAQDAVWDSHLANIVEESCTRQNGQIRVWHGHASRDGYTKGGNALAVALDR